VAIELMLKEPVLRIIMIWVEPITMDITATTRADSSHFV
jgi:hypothetical protein